MIFQNMYIMYCNINNKDERSSDVILTSMSEHEQSNILNKEIDDSQDNAKNNQPFLKILTYLLTSMIFYQDPLRYGTVMKFCLIPMEGGTLSYVLTNVSKVN